MTDHQAKTFTMAARRAASACFCEANRPPRTLWPRRFIRNALRAWLRSLYNRYAYRHVMRFIHRFGLHHAPATLPIGEGESASTRHHWCQWCGLRGTTIVYNPNDRLF